MSDFYQRAASPRHVHEWLPQIVALLAASAAAQIVCSLPRTHSLSLGDVVVSATKQVLVVFATAAATVWVLCAFRPLRAGSGSSRIALRTALDALWLAPLTLFLHEDSAWAIAVTAVLVASAANSLLRTQDRRRQADFEQALAQPMDETMFGLLGSSSRRWRQLAAVAAALCAQTSALAGLAGYPLKASVLAGISSAVWTWSFTTDLPPGQVSTPARSRRVALILTLAIGFTAGGLARYLRIPRWFGVVAGPLSGHSHPATAVGVFGLPFQDHPPRTVLDEEQPGQAGFERTSEGPAAGTKDSNSGIILWPGKPQHTKLVAPVPTMGNSPLKGTRAANPLIIPFNGVYWFFKVPDSHPPRTSRQAHGSPELLEIHSTDRRPLSMEAHENFGSVIDLDCCSRIQIAIRNADLYPESVSLELILVNSSLPGKPSQSLGTVRVKSKRSWKPGDGGTTATETLNFAIPPDRSLRRFDEVTIVFRLNAFRADDGAKIAIDRLVLIPRGL